MKTHLERLGMGFALHLLFSVRPLRAADRFHFFHSFLHRRFCEERALFEFLQNAGPLVFLFETF